MFRSAGVARTLTMLCVLSLGPKASSAQEPQAETPEPQAETPESQAETPEPQAETPEADASLPAGLLQARTAINDAQFTDALNSLEQALQSGRCQPVHLQEIYLLLGETSVAVGKEEEAKGFFQLLLVLNPDASLGEFASPKIVAVLDRARSELNGATLQAGHSFAPGTRRLELVVQSNPLGQALQARLSYPREDASVAQLSIPLDGGKAIFDLPAQAKEEVALALLDRYGNLLSEWQVDDMPVEAANPIVGSRAGEGSSSRSTRPLWAKWWVWAGATGAMATVGTAFGIASRSAQSDLDEVTANPGEHFFREAESLEDKARRRANVANVSFVLAGVMGLTSGLLYWRSRNDEASLQVVPATEGAGASLIMGGHF